jgi:hypothetical protein
LKITIDYIECNVRTGMTQMTLPTYGGTTDIHAHVPGHQGGKNFFLSGQRIIDTKLGHMAKMIKINGIE